MDNIAIIGASGSMGTRYQAILRYLGKTPMLFDEDTWGQCLTTVGVEGIIICSPTAEHIFNIKELQRLGVPILCEKPVSCEFGALESILDLDINLTMVNQYAFIRGIDGDGPTYYDYYNTGKDGIEWDCLNIIGLAKGDCYINNDSPVWKCMINGKKLTLEEVNKSYVDMLDSWLKDPKENREYIIESHKRIWSGKYVKGGYRDSGKDDKPETPKKVHDGDQRKTDVGVGYKSRPKVSNVFKPRS